MVEIRDRRKDDTTQSNIKLNCISDSEDRNNKGGCSAIYRMFCAIICQSPIRVSLKWITVVLKIVNSWWTNRSPFSSFKSVTRCWQVLTVSSVLTESQINLRCFCTLTRIVFLTIDCVIGILFFFCPVVVNGIRSIVSWMPRGWCQTIIVYIMSCDGCAC